MKLILIASAFSLFIFTMCSSHEGNETTATTTVTDSITGEKNKQLILTIYAEMINKRNPALVDSFIDANIIDHAAFPGQEQGIVGFKKAVNELIGLFSDVRVTVDDLIAADNMVASHETWNVTTAKDNKNVTGKTMHVFKIENGKIKEEWSKGWEWLNNL